MTDNFHGVTVGKTVEMSEIVFFIDLWYSKIILFANRYVTCARDPSLPLAKKNGRKR